MIKWLQKRRLLLCLVCWNIFFVTTLCQDVCEENQFSCESNPPYDVESYEDSPPSGLNDDYDSGLAAPTEDFYNSDSSMPAYGSTRCLPNNLKCNEIPDCLDCSDERNCTTNTVFWCGSALTGTCIPNSKRCDNQTDCSNGADECDCPGAFRCPSGSNVLCVPAPRVCNGKSDCENGEDETTTCEVYRCPTNGKTLVLSQVCDGVNSCGDSAASDECNCSFTFHCDSGECIHNSSVCDGVNNCSDGSDECDCAGVVSFRCNGSGTCIDAIKVCDGALDCGSYVHRKTFQADLPTSNDEFYVMDCSDETQGNCSTFFQCHDAKIALLKNNIQSDLITCVDISRQCDGTPDCDDSSDECSCTDSVACPASRSQNKRDAYISASPSHQENQCLLRKNFCDAVQHCAGGSDEMTRGFGFKCSIKSTQSSNVPCLIPQTMIDDGVTDCSNNADVCYRSGKWRCFLCFDNSLLISYDQICDGVLDCPDLSDECACQENRPAICDAVCHFNGTNDCVFGAISCGAPPSKNSTSRHRDLHNVTYSRICDDEFDCFDLSSDAKTRRDRALHIDEEYCGKEEPHTNKFRCPAGGITSPKRPLFATRCDQRPECAGFEDECDLAKPCGTVPKFCENVSASVDIRLRGEPRFPCSQGFLPTSEADGFGLPGAMVCDGKIDCAGPGEDEIYCPQRFYCDVAENVISINKSQVCDGRFDCVDIRDEMNCSEFFYCENGEPFYVPKSARFDGTEDCSDKSDECPKEQLEGTFASVTEMIDSPFLKVLVWIMAFISTIGNIIVIAYQIYIFCKPPKIGNHNVALSNRVLILNLAFADFLTGVYLLTLAINSVHFAGIYCQEDKLWRTSNSCANLGFLNSVATEAAVVILVIMTTYRLLAVYKPFETSSFRPQNIALICACGWIIVIVTMMLPRLDRFINYFSDAAWYPQPFLSSDIVSKEDLLQFIRRYHILTGNYSQLTENTWSAIDAFVAEGHLNESHYTKFGYYSKHSVCIPNMLASSGDAAVAFSATVTTVNMLAFIYVVVAYIFIYKGAVEKHEMGTQYTQATTYVMRTHSAKPLVSGNESFHNGPVVTQSAKVTAMQGRIVRLVFSNLACWVPLTLLAILKLCGVQMSDEAYAIAAIVLLPITSTLNPLLYSNFLSFAWRRCKGKLCGKRIDNPPSNDQYRSCNRSNVSMSVKSTHI